MLANEKEIKRLQLSMYFTRIMYEKCDSGKKVFCCGKVEASKARSSVADGVVGVVFLVVVVVKSLIVF